MSSNFFRGALLKNMKYFHLKTRFAVKFKTLFTSRHMLEAHDVY